jgi:hypothetical protein
MHFNLYNLKVNTSAIEAERLMKESDVVAPCIFLDTVHISLIHDAHIHRHQGQNPNRKSIDTEKLLLAEKSAFLLPYFLLGFGLSRQVARLGEKLQRTERSYKMCMASINFTNGPYTFRPNTPPPPPSITASLFHSVFLSKVQIFHGRLIL